MYADWKAPTYKDQDFYYITRRPFFSHKEGPIFSNVTPEVNPEIRSLTVKGTRPSTTRHDSVAQEEEKKE